ncbi:hypothetical protein WKW79_15070 [Variovorax robiniae]|uniref:Uncharacterized protein n=1 Tax=Variovorax robiniae TaxID=1836199 RepID=A0ABU8X7T4_9BURK
MFHSLPAAWLAAPLAALAVGTAAQPAPDPAGAPPSASLPAPLPYVSAFEGYKPFKEEKPIAWREANETVYRRGGWRAYANESAESKAPEGEPKDPHAGMGHAMPMPTNKERP